jgi:hypoxanthine phosphoribosyltransferase
MSPTYSTLLNWVFGVATLISLALTVYYGRRAGELERSRKKLEWPDLQAAAADLAGMMATDKFVPDAVFTPSLRGATFVNLLLGELEREVPVFVGIASWKDAPGAVATCNGFFCLETNKWYVHVPDCLPLLTQAKLLVVDDFAMSGDFISRLKEALVTRGFASANIRTMCIVTTKVALHNRKAPDYYWMETSDDSFYFPWGRAR